MTIFEDNFKGPAAGPGCEFTNSIAIRGHEHFNGAGGNNFGGANKWPHLTITVNFRTGDYATQQKWREAFKQFIKTLEIEAPRK